MSDSLMDLLTSYQAAVDAARRSLTVARQMTDGLLSGQHPPHDVVQGYALQLEREEARLTELTAKLHHFQTLIDTMRPDR